MKRLFWIILCCSLVVKLGLAAPPKTVMLVLGSADPDVLNERIAIAARLYRTQPVQKIIVSGGCGAHGSGICEATSMQQGLIDQGVEPARIYKEENAKTTVQNYVFSRVLRDEHDQRIIQPGDTVFVVSNHWHAISVAARLQKYDGVTARFYIEGSLAPKDTDKLDYVGIFNAQPDNTKFVLRGSWMTPDARWTVGDSTYYLSHGLVYGTDARNNSFSLQKGVAVLPFLSTLDTNHSQAFIDAGKFWWVRNGSNLIKISKDTKKILESRVWGDWINGLPARWKEGAFATGVLWNDKLILFANDKILLAKATKKGFVFEKEMTAGEYFDGWPFSWGKSNVASATVDPATGQLVLHRNMETVRVGKDLKVVGKPAAFKLKWIDDLK